MLSVMVDFYASFAIAKVTPCATRNIFTCLATGFTFAFFVKLAPVDDAIMYFIGAIAVNAP